MKRSISKVLVTSFAVIATASAYALPKGPCEKPEVCCDEPKPGPFAFTFPGDLGLACPRDFYVHVDGLAFQAKQDGMEFLIRDTSGAAAPLSGGEVLGFDSDNNDWDYNPGVRVGLGAYLNHDAWNIDFNWTWLNITNTQVYGTPSGGSQIIPTTILGTSTQPNGSTITAKGVWKASYDAIDLRLGKAYHVSRHVKFNPHFGVRGAWIQQNFATRYGTQVNNILQTGNTFTAAAAVSNPIQHGDNDFWGIGARTGVDTDWMLGKGWCLFANVSASMLFGKFDVTQKFEPSNGTTDGIDLERTIYQNVPNFEMALGIGWNERFVDNKYQISLRAAYEFIEWFDQLNMRKFVHGSPDYTNDVISRGNLTMNGFSLKLQLDI